MAPTGVQSLHRALDLLEVIADDGGALGLSDLAAATSLPLPTIHRILATLTDRGYVRRLSDRRYALGHRLVPLGTAARALAGLDADAVLTGLVDDLGETANLAVLADDHVEYVAQVPSRHSMRMFTEVGRSVELHCTGVGKAMLAQLDDDRVRHLIARQGLAPRTDHTLTTPETLLADLARIRERGYAVDEQEQEIGVRCVAVALPTAGGAWAAVSVSGPLTRMSDDVVARAVPLLQAAADRLAAASSTSTDATRPASQTPEDPS